MPFKSVAQRKALFAKNPKLAARWVKKYGWKVKRGKAKARK